MRYPAVNGEEERRAYVYLPTMYEADPDRRYPVLYMFDGQNVFFDSDATYGKIAAARALGLPVILVDRPARPGAATTVDAALQGFLFDALHVTKLAESFGPHSLPSSRSTMTSALGMAFPMESGRMSACSGGR